jgi:serine/threonine protein kinase
MSKLIDQGGFGCVFYPGFNCKSDFKKTDNKLVSKLQMNTFNARNEIYIGSLIQKISNYQLYYLPVISSCNITMASISQDIIDKCDIIEKDNDKYKILELPYLENISFDNLFSDTKRSIRHLFLTFIETYKYVAIAIGNLIDHNIVHFDIKEQNILYSTKYENPILIDFGLSIPINKISNSNLKDYFYVYAPEYYLWPLEVHIINYILHEGKLTNDSIKNTVNIYVKNNSAFNALSDEFREKYITASINYFTKFIKFDSATTIIQLLDFFKTWDLYSLSIMYLKFFNKLFKKGYFQNNFIISFSQLLLQNISPFPENRYSPSDTQKKYTDIFFINEKPHNYTILIQQLEN